MNNPRPFIGGADWGRVLMDRVDIDVVCGFGGFKGRRPHA
jgi:hypothetical protein